MCNITENFMLCTCEEIKFREPITYEADFNNCEPKVIPRENLPELVIVWSLKHASHNGGSLFGEMKVSYNAVDLNYDNNFILSQLNNLDCFDFHYTPRNGDELSFKTNEFGSKQVFFTFKDHKWTAGSHHSFNYTFKEIASGILENK